MQAQACDVLGLEVEPLPAIDGASAEA